MLSAWGSGFPAGQAASDSPLENSRALRSENKSPSGPGVRVLSRHVGNPKRCEKGDARSLHASLTTVQIEKSASFRRVGGHGHGGTHLWVGVSFDRTIVREVRLQPRSIGIIAPSLTPHSPPTTVSREGWSYRYTMSARMP